MPDGFIKVLSRFWFILEKKFLPAYVWECDPFTFWQERILFIICFTASVFGPFALVPSVLLSLSLGLMNVAVLDIGGYLGAVAVLVFRNTSLKFRSNLIFCTLYFLGSGLLFILGPVGAGYIWLLGASIIVGTIDGLKAVFLSLILNACTLLLIALYLSNGRLDWVILMENPLEKWLVMTANFLLINALVTVTTALMLNSLKNTIQNEQSVRLKLQESEKRYRTLFETAKDAIFLLKDDILIDCNLASVAMFGYADKSEILGSPPWKFSPENQPDGQNSQQKAQDLIKDAFHGKSHNFEWRHQRKNGELVDSEVSLNRLILKKESYLQAVVRDVTERKRAEDNLRDSQARLYTVFNAVESIPVQGYDLDRRVIFWNCASEHVYGYTSEEAMGRKLEELIIPEPMRNEVVKGICAWYEDDIEIPAGELVLQNKNGEPVSVFSSHVMFINRAGDKEMFCIDVDLSSHKQIENEKAQMEEQYRQAQKMESIGRLAGGVAHDLNNLLSPILGYSEILMDDLGVEDPRRDSANAILQAGFSARDLVRQLLAFSRKQTLEVKPIDLNRTILDFKKLLLRTIREDIEMELILSSNLRLVKADIGQIEQVLMNMVVNSADSMPNGGRLTIETNLAHLDGEYAKAHGGVVVPGLYVLMAISDTGCGMDEEICSKIFEPFFSTKGERGTGLGLATVYGIVKQHGGNIWVYSEPGKGSTFKIFLPAAADQGELEEKSDLQEIKNLNGVETILLVEDDEYVRNLVNIILKQKGYTILVAEDGNHALTLLEKHDGPVSMMLTDVVMPGMNGREIYNKAAQKYPGLKVLYMSGYTTNVIAHHGILEKGVEFIQKPFTARDLATKIRKMLGVRMNQDLT